MSADRLREAADRIDALAEAATPGPWEASERDVNDLHFGPVPSACLDALGHNIFAVSGMRFDTAAYIAAMHPGVGKALAAWLRGVEKRTLDFSVTHGEWNDAHALVDVILGGES